MKLPFFNRSRPDPALNHQPSTLNRARRASALSSAMHVRMANGWRDQFNPLRNLTIQRLIGLLEAGERGEYADLQWLFRFIEMTDATLGALLARYDGGLLKLAWEIKTVPEDRMPKGGTVALAEQQAAALREQYDAIDNLQDALQFLVLAKFRGYSHLEKIYGGAKWGPDRNGKWELIPGDLEPELVTHLEPVPQWHWCRDGINGPWLYNREAKSGTNKGEPVDYDQFVIREVGRPINRVGSINNVYSNLGRKDWAGFVETYGIPPLFLIGPPQVDAGKEAEYQQIAEDIIADARGYLPNGADIKTADAGDRGQNPFRDFLTYLKEETVLLGTGGKLTMLAESGSGTLAGSAHQDAWDDICQSEAKLLSSVLQKQIDGPRLDLKFPGQPKLAYFDLCAHDEDDPNEVADQTQKFSSAGYEIDPEQLSEKTGYRITKKELPEMAPGSPSPGGEGRGEGGKYRNRALTVDPERLLAVTLQRLGKAQEETLQPLRDRIATVLELEDPLLFNAGLRRLRADLPRILIQINANPATADVLEPALVAGLLNGAVTSKEEQTA